ncbi:MarR family transcriptional regulator [Ktedonobacter sp. SOSP1-85]|uniref:MarR family winged helix-turn-helix transcriptional regulator n=1 Tax=Ktedonobacter sp. SOSP1-85 TaxID=2778367 RepID=UPI0019153569|nr:MarR family transcriptional regulator [Ktedonobacter sp. SOSP1-85]GHO79013.1 MarR family transcriptional regulator [Ktedonobacter sp. SOSP1-85]
MEFAPNYELTPLLMLGSRTVIDDLHRHMAALGYDDVRPAHGFAFQRLAPYGATGNELAEFLDITKQAASEMIDYLEKRGYVTRQPNPADKRGKIVTLTERGWGCIRETEAFLTRLEAQWAEIIGPRRMAELRADLRQLIMAANGGILPHKFRPVW